MTAAGIDPEALRRLRHDLRSPLVVIDGFAQLLARDGELSDDSRRDYARRISGAAGELRRLVDEALAESSGAAGKKHH